MSNKKGKFIGKKNLVYVSFLNIIFCGLGTLIFSDYSIIFCICCFLWFCILLFCLFTKKDDFYSYAIISGLLIIVLSAIGVPYVISKSNVLIKMEVEDLETAKMFAIFSVPALLIGLDSIIMFLLKLKLAKKIDIYFIFVGIIFILIGILLLNKINFI